ncbi:MAG: ABC transporter permease [Verrucomicrobia bacterium]|nr:ABC transporter permease [Verrucomicrobiota bacterium]
MKSQATRCIPRSALLLMSPTWLVLGLLFLVPLVIMLWLSFQHRGLYGGIEPGPTLANYVRSFESGYAIIYARSVWIAVATTVICLLVSYPVAYYIALKARPERKNLLLALVVIPFWTSFLVRTYAWMFILRDQGVINSLLMSLGVTHEPLPLLYTPLAVMIGQVYAEVPFMVLPIYASLEKLDRSLLEAARDLGASAAAAFWRVTAPLAMPGTVAGIVLVFIPSLGTFITPDLLGGAKGMLVGNLIQNQFGPALNKPFGSAVAMTLTVFVLALLWAYAAWARRRGEEVVL